MATRGPIPPVLVNNESEGDNLFDFNFFLRQTSSSEAVYVPTPITAFTETDLLSQLEEMFESEHKQPSPPYIDNTATDMDLSQIVNELIDLTKQPPHPQIQTQMSAKRQESGFFTHDELVSIEDGFEYNLFEKMLESTNPMISMVM